MDLVTLRKELGLSQEECAKALDLKSKSYICGIERGNVQASLRLAMKIDRWSGGRIKASSLNPAAAEIARTRVA